MEGDSRIPRSPQGVEDKVGPGGLWRSHRPEDNRRGRQRYHLCGYWGAEVSVVASWLGLEG